MDDREQREFLSSLTRSHINQLCLEMQSLITNLKTFLADTHGYSDAELTKIMTGTIYDDLNINDVQRPAPSGSADPMRKLKKTHKNTNPETHDLSKLKKEDEEIRRSLTFELEWIMAQLANGKFPY